MLVMVMLPLLFFNPMLARRGDWLDAKEPLNKSVLQGLR
jgi:hypothetical protein